jgi:hypothetical protein
MQGFEDGVDIMPFAENGGAVIDDGMARLCVRAVVEFGTVRKRGGSDTAYVVRC